MACVILVFSSDVQRYFTAFGSLVSSYMEHGVALTEDIHYYSAGSIYRRIAVSARGLCRGRGDPGDDAHPPQLPAQGDQGAHAPVPQHGQGAPWAAPQLGFRASSGCV